jgi:hypothetical protein
VVGSEWVGGLKVGRFESLRNRIKVIEDEIKNKKAQNGGLLERHRNQFH